MYSELGIGRVLSSGVWGYSALKRPLWLNAKRECSTLIRRLSDSLGLLPGSRLSQRNLNSELSRLRFVVAILEQHENIKVTCACLRYCEVRQTDDWMDRHHLQVLFFFVFCDSIKCFSRASLDNCYIPNTAHGRQAQMRAHEYARAHFTMSENE